jgi:flagellar basal body-associated protein FliL
LPLAWGYLIGTKGRGGCATRTAPKTAKKEAAMSIWLLILIIVLVVLALGGFGYNRRR